MGTGTALGSEIVTVGRTLRSTPLGTTRPLSDARVPSIGITLGPVRAHSQLALLRVRRKLHRRSRKNLRSISWVALEVTSQWPPPASISFPTRIKPFHPWAMSVLTVRRQSERSFKTLISVMQMMILLISKLRRLHLHRHPLLPLPIPSLH
jgi:hypothetical protein